MTERIILIIIIRVIRLLILVDKTSVIVKLEINAQWMDNAI